METSIAAKTTSASTSTTAVATTAATTKAATTTAAATSTTAVEHLMNTISNENAIRCDSMIAPLATGVSR